MIRLFHIESKTHALSGVRGGQNMMPGGFTLKWNAVNLLKKDPKT
jgi:hypothetical protein